MSDNVIEKLKKTDMLVSIEERVSIIEDRLDAVEKNNEDTNLSLKDVSDGLAKIEKIINDRELNTQNKFIKIEKIITNVKNQQGRNLGWGS